MARLNGWVMIHESLRRSGDLGLLRTSILFHPCPGQRYTIRVPGADLASMYIRIDLFEDIACQRRIISATMDLRNMGPPSTFRSVVPPSLWTVLRIHFQVGGEMSFIFLWSPRCIC